MQKALKLPVGTLVMGETRTGLHGFPGHKGHIFKLLTNPKKVKLSNSGYQQDVKCVPCKQTFTGVTGSFYRSAPTMRT